MDFLTVLYLYLRYTLNTHTQLFWRLQSTVYGVNILFFLYQKIISNSKDEYVVVSRSHVLFTKQIRTIHSWNQGLTCNDITQPLLSNFDAIHILLMLIH